MESLGSVAPADALAWLLKLRGIGPWTAGYVIAAAGGDPDAVPVGDYHLPKNITYALSGEPMPSDDRMLELLEPYAGQRQRVVRLIKLGRIASPRRHSRMPRRSIARL